MQGENDILMMVARRALAPSDVTRLRGLIDARTDWDYLVTTARQHGLIPLLHKHASNSFADLLPAKVRSDLKRESVTNAQSVLHLVGKSLKLQKLLRDNGIACALFKGALLSELAYGEIGLRQAGDIDILIRREDFLQTKELLLSLGYQVHPQLTAAQETSHLANHCEIQFIRDDWFTVVDLHWDLTPRSFVFGVSGNEVMSRLQTVPFAGSQVQTFSAEDLLLYLSMHGAKHLWLRLEWISSLAELVRSLPDSAWPLVLERALAAHATRILGLGLRLTETVFATDVPTQVLETVDPDEGMRELAKHLANDLFVPRIRWADSTDTNLFNLKIMDRKRDAFVSVLRAIFVPTFSDWEALKLPSSLHPFYYAFRPMRLSKVYSGMLLRRLIQKSALQ